MRGPAGAAPAGTAAPQRIHAAATANTPAAVHRTDDVRPSSLARRRGSTPGRHSGSEATATGCRRMDSAGSRHAESSTGTPAPAPLRPLPRLTASAPRTGAVSDEPHRGRATHLGGGDLDRHAVGFDGEPARRARDERRLGREVQFDGHLAIVDRAGQARSHRHVAPEESAQDGGRPAVRRDGLVVRRDDVPAAVQVDVVQRGTTDHEGIAVAGALLSTDGSRRRCPEGTGSP